MEPGGAARILLVDDHEAGRQATACVLRQAGHDVLEAASGEAALASLEAQAPDLAILDIGLPGCSGRDVLRVMKSRPELALVPALCLSASYPEAEDIAAGLQDGADAYLTKPVQLPGAAGASSGPVARAALAPGTGPRAGGSRGHAPSASRGIRCVAHGRRHGPRSRVSKRDPESGRGGRLRGHFRLQRIVRFPRGYPALPLLPRRRRTHARHDAPADGHAPGPPPAGRGIGGGGRGRTALVAPHEHRASPRPAREGDRRGFRGHRHYRSKGSGTRARGERSALPAGLGGRPSPRVRSGCADAASQGGLGSHGPARICARGGRTDAGVVEPAHSPGRPPSQ